MQAQINSSEYSVVVVGAMNPAIHHPQWYEAVGMLTAEEAQDAVRGGALVIVPQVAQFQAAGLQIQCTPARWQINTSDQQQRTRIIDIAAVTFQRLGETPISAYGLNERFALTIGSEHAIEMLGAQLSKGPVDLSFEGSRPDFESLAISYGMYPITLEGQPNVQRQLKATIARATHGPDAIIVAFNMHHTMAARPEFSRFELDRLLRGSVAAFEVEDALLQRILDALTGFKG
jgi:hypothetical protein